MKPFPYPVAAEFLNQLAGMFGEKDYTEVLWHLRETEQRRRNEARASVHERFGAIVRRLRGAEPVRRKPVLQIIRNALAACL